MSGVAGVIRFDGCMPSAEDVRAMCDAMVHRGPDDQGLYVDDIVAIGMRRLSIIDLDTGHQPVHNEDRTVWVVFDGEIYNFKELRRDLEQRGHRFYTTSDTEVIVHLYEEYGDAGVQHLRGMFAYALWDTRRRRMLIARDRVGIKPLYYATVGRSLAFGSELKTVLEVPQIARRLNWQALGHLLTFGTTPATESIIDGVRKLEPGHQLAITGDGRTSVEQYWDVTFAPDTAPSEAEWTERLRALLLEAVDLHCRSDVPLGVLLNGGIDSSAVVAMLARVTPGRLKTFSIGFAEAGDDELSHARETARAFNAEHHELVLEPQGWDTFLELTNHLDEPLGDPALLPTYTISRLAAEHVKVVLSGDGGDEIFCGYDKYIVERRARKFDRIPGPVRRMLGAAGEAMPEGTRGRNFLRHIAVDGPRRTMHASAMFGRAEQNRLFDRSVAGLVTAVDPFVRGADYLKRQSGSWLSALQDWDLHAHLPLEILPKVDRMTMAHSIEARPVLLDHKLIEFAASVPSELLLRGRVTKYLFKQAMRGVLPDAIIDRKKPGFAVPLSRWFRGDLSNFMRDVLLSDTSRQRGIFDRNYLEQLLKMSANGRNLERELMTLVSFELWCRAVLDGRPGLRGAGAQGRTSKLTPAFARR